ncbi:hypothetical protein [Sphingomonas oryzagri]|uniref:DUF4136 domain-containing protein n=1 Tax=Sphingomonas oryzagri TaxID=3042314 RepID=A0ABT6MY25_9SPHN|nr:hypothetical protein [Sphingomonas oryzagri]MDH7637959.1 hypothetical protein [Sphingomonas oryzagri]
MKRLILGLALALAGLVAAPSLAAAPPPHGGTTTLHPSVDGDYDPSLHIFADAARDALTSKGFTILEDPAHTAYVVDLTLSRADIGTGMGKGPRDPAEVVGTGVVVPLSTGNSAIVALRRTKIDVRIRNRADNSVVWSGSAVTVRSTGARNGTDEAVATDLTRALLQIYPTQPEDTIGVP